MKNPPICHGEVVFHFVVENLWGLKAQALGYSL